MNYKIISIVTLTYKKFENIYRAIDSVLIQSYPNIEYIIADDGSPNFPEKEIYNYIIKNKKNNIVSFKIIKNKTNKGTVRNINNAYSQAIGDIIMPLSGDDIFYDSSVVSKIVERFNDLGSDLIVSSRMICDKEGNELYQLPKKKNLKRIYALNTPYRQHNAFLTEEFYDMASGSVMYLKKSLLENYGYFDESYRLWEDGPFLTKYTKKNCITSCYDIISIKYCLGGISNEAMNPLMINDIIHYNKTDRIEEINKVGGFTKQKIHYLCERYQCETWIDILIVYLKYPLVLLSKFIYKYIIK